MNFPMAVFGENSIHSDSAAGFGGVTSGDGSLGRDDELEREGVSADDFVTS